MTSGPRHLGVEHSNIQAGEAVAAPSWLYRAAVIAPPVRDKRGGCGDCGQGHVRQGKPTCSAHRSRKQLPAGSPKLPCKNFPPVGSPVCRFHGGAAPQVERAAFGRVLETKVHEMAVEIMDKLAVTDPYVLLPEKRPKKGGHKNKDSRSAKRAKRQRETFRRDKPPTS